MGMELGFELFENVIQNTNVFELTWLFSIILTLLTLLMITRDTQKWRQLLFPVLIGWDVAGVNPHPLTYVFVAIIYGIDIMSLQLVTSFIGVSSRERVKSRKYYTGGVKDEYRRLQLKEKKKHIAQEFKTAKLTPDFDIDKFNVDERIKAFKEESKKKKRY